MRASSGNSLNDLRRLVQERRVENGGGILPESLTAAAEKIGTTHASLSTFMRGKTDASVELCIKLAAYIDRADYPPSVIVRLAGFSNEADIMAGDAAAWRAAREAPAPVRA